MTIVRTLASLLALTAATALAASVDAQSPLPADAYLGPAPWVDPAAPLPAIEPSTHAKAVASVPAIDTSNRAAVVSAYNTYYNLTMPAVGFTGSTAGCNRGTISLAFQEWTITRINFMRAMAGVPGSTTLDSSKDVQEQAAALIMAANSTLTHAPTSNMTCYTPDGFNGASSSNLAIGTGMTDSIPLYMSDPGGGNQVAGHRRWILHSAKDSFGLGEANGSPYNASALYVFQFGAAVSVPNGIPWPPRGYVPLALFPTPFSEGPRWSFGLPGANFGSSTVTLTLNGSPLATTVVAGTSTSVGGTANGYGDNTIVWELPVGHTVAKGSTYNVTISGVANAASTSYTYQVLPIDPADVVVPPPVTPPRLFNISTRGQVLTGNDVMIGGFVIGGSTPKTVIIRARGPSLVPFGIANALSNPVLQLFSGQTLLATNDNWGGAANNAAISASGFAPGDAFESAILVSLSPGAYTALVSGSGGGTGVGIVEVFEVDHPEIPLANISTRGQVLTGNDVMIGGFVIQGSGPQTVVIRARGPSLVPFGITNALANPTLQLYSGSTLLASNDDWGSATNAVAITASGFAPSNPLESAILITLNPGAYTAIVSGVGGATGVGIVEVFAQ